MGSQQSPETTLVPGQKVGGGRFVLVRLLGHGGMGVVWLARDERLDEQVALKFLPREIHHDSAAMDDLRREAARTRKLTHPNILRIHDFHEDPGEPPFISMEYVDGPTLSSLRVEQAGRVFAWEFLKPLVKQLCEALDHAHEKHVIHRDLKPANMMLDSQGCLKLADFGIAAVTADSMSRVSMRRPTSGTLTHMSPQQLDGRAPRVTDDLYSLGATLYELLSSKPPFFSGDIPFQVRSLAPDSIEERLAELDVKNEVPPAVAAMIMACLAKDPALRPQKARAVAEWIGLSGWTESSRKATREKAAVAPDASVAAEPAIIDEHSKTRRSTWLWVGLAAAILLLTGFIGWKIKNRPATNGAARAMAQNAKTFPRPGKRWTNSLGQIFAPVPDTPVLFCIWHTRVQDFEAFVTATGYDARENMNSFRPGDGTKVRGDSWKSPGFAQGPTHPVCGVSWVDAQAYCSWLTDKERKEGRLNAGQVYRLPMDLEWSAAVGLDIEFGKTPSERSGKIQNFFPWGTQWPPPRLAGNYPAELGVDHFEFTSPVGSFAPNRFGLYDMGGNLEQWCEDLWDNEHDYRLVRGGSWLNYGDGRSSLLLSFRNVANRSNRYCTGGFRVVLVVGYDDKAQPNVAETKPIVSPEDARAATAQLPRALAARLVWIKPGAFTMGWLPGESVGGDGGLPQTEVKIVDGFWMGRYEVTQAEFQEVCNFNPSHFLDDSRLPVHAVSWAESMDYCNRLTARERAANRLPKGLIYRLPTEAEWEYACRAGTRDAFSPGNDESDLQKSAWYSENSGNQPHVVGGKSPNPWGLYDMLGNVWEWCAGEFIAPYPGGTVTNWSGATTGTIRVFRGGAWNHDARANHCSVRGNSPDERSWNNGFRIVLAPPFNKENQ